MPHPDQAVVTGAFSYTGRYVARRLLDQGISVRTLTRNPQRQDPFGDRVLVLQRRVTIMDSDCDPCQS